LIQSHKNKLNNKFKYIKKNHIESKATKYSSQLELILTIKTILFKNIQT